VYWAADMRMMETLINLVLFLYIVSIYMFTFIPGLNSISNLIAGIFVFLVISWFFINRKKVVFNPFLFLFLLFILVCGISYFVALAPSLVIVSFRVLFLNWVFMLILMNYLDRYDKVEKLFSYFIYAGTLAAGYILIYSDFTRITRLGEVLGNENVMGIIIGISFIMALYKIIFQKQYRNILFLIPMAPVILLTGSRKAALLIVMGILILLYMKYHRSFTRRIQFFMVSGLLLLVFYYLIFYIPPIYMVLGRRFQSLLDFLGAGSTTEDSILVRDFMIRFGLDMFKLRPVLGYGMDNYRVLLNSEIGMETYAHNNFVELLVDTGIIGTACYYAMYANVLMGLKRCFGDNHGAIYLLFSLIITFLILGYTFVQINSKHLYILLALGSIIGKFTSGNTGRIRSMKGREL